MAYWSDGFGYPKAESTKSYSANPRLWTRNRSISNHPDPQSRVGLLSSTEQIRQGCNASNKAIETFKNYYPETLSRKFFVNVPVWMGWMFSAVSLVLSKETVKKFRIPRHGKKLKCSLGYDVPSVYGGLGRSLEERGVGPSLGG